MSLNMKYWHARFIPKSKSLIYELIYLKNMFYPATIKNYNRAVAMSIFLVRRKRKLQLHQFLKRTT